MDRKWTTLIRDPQGWPTPEARSAALREVAEEVFGALVQSLVNKALEISPPVPCPDALAKRIGKHNERAGDFLTRRLSWVERYCSLPMKEAEPSVKPRQAIEDREAVLLEQFEVFCEHAALLEARAVVLGEVLPVLREEAKAAEATLEHERGKADKSLRRMGHAPEDDVQFRMNVRAAEVRFAQKVNAAAPVRAAQEALAGVRSRIAATEAQALGIADDVALIEALKYEAMGEAVGGS